MDVLDYDYFSQSADTNQVMRTIFNSTGSTNLYQTYLLGKLKLSENIIFTGGLHYS